MIRLYKSSKQWATPRRAQLASGLGGGGERTRRWPVALAGGARPGRYSSYRIDTRRDFLPVWSSPRPAESPGRGRAEGVEERGRAEQSRSSGFVERDWAVEMRRRAGAGPASLTYVFMNRIARRLARCTRKCVFNAGARAGPGEAGRGGVGQGRALVGLAGDKGVGWLPRPQASTFVCLVF